MKHLESRMLGNLHVQFGVRARVAFAELVKTCMPKLGQTEIVWSSLSSQKGMDFPGACDVRFKVD